MMSWSDSAGSGSRTARPSAAAGRSRPARPVTILWTYAWWPVSHRIRSCGESNTRCSARVSSTAPRLGPRWPRGARHRGDQELADLLRPASSSCATVEPPQVPGSVDRVQHACGESTAGVTGSGAGTGVPRSASSTRATRPLGADQAGALPLVRRHGGRHRLGVGHVAQLVPGRRQPAPGRLDAGLDVVGGEPGQHHRVPAQHLVRAGSPAGTGRTARRWRCAPSRGCPAGGPPPASREVRRAGSRHTP